MQRSLRNRARLWLRPEVRDPFGRTVPAEWVAFVGGERFRTGCGPDELDRAKRIATERLKEMAEKAKAPAVEVPRQGRRRR